MKRVAIIGAGAAGCFCAAVLHRMSPDCQIKIYESGPVPMAKLALTGGGRCNLTNTFEEVEDLSKVYPRGYRLMKRALNSFGPDDTKEWFRSLGVRLKVEDGGRVFPCSDDAMEIVGAIRKCLEGVEIEARHPVRTVDELQGYDAIVVTTGGGTAKIVESLGINIREQVPSLFTFNVNDKELNTLGGIVLNDVSVGISGTKFKSDGNVLLTHWGLSGPAILRLSSYAAESLHDSGYRAVLSINYHTDLDTLSEGNSQKMIRSTHPDNIPSRFWEYLTAKSGLRPDIRWAEAGSKGLNRLKNILTNDCYEISGKGAFKEEFVTCGGVSLDEINPGTLESKKCPGLYFAGEVLDIDAVTGGFNLQAAWTTAYLAARSIAE